MPDEKYFSHEQIDRTRKEDHREIKGPEPPRINYQDPESVILLKHDIDAMRGCY